MTNIKTEVGGVGRVMLDMVMCGAVKSCEVLCSWKHCHSGAHELRMVYSTFPLQLNPQQREEDDIIARGARGDTSIPLTSPHSTKASF